MNNAITTMRDIEIPPFKSWDQVAVPVKANSETLDYLPGVVGDVIRNDEGQFVCEVTCCEDDDLVKRTVLAADINLVEATLASEPQRLTQRLTKEAFRRLLYDF